MNIKPKATSAKDSLGTGLGTGSKASEPATASSRQLLCWKDKTLFVMSTCFGLGYVPWAPGTVSALLGVGIYLVIIWLAPVALHDWMIATALLLFSVLTLILAPWAERYWQRKDPNVFVTDEVAGFLLTVLLFRLPNLPLTVLWTFVLTRLFDIVKIPPARQLERIHGGIGILADDLCSSLYAAGVLHLLSACVPSWFGLP